MASALPIKPAPAWTMFKGKIARPVPRVGRALTARSAPWGETARYCSRVSLSRRILTDNTRGEQNFVESPWREKSLVLITLNMICNLSSSTTRNSQFGTSHGVRLRLSRLIRRLGKDAMLIGFYSMTEPSIALRRIAQQERIERLIRLKRTGVRTDLILIWVFLPWGQTGL